MATSRTQNNNYGNVPCEAAAEPEAVPVIAGYAFPVAGVEPDILATVRYLVIDAGLEQVRISCAGHLTPIIALESAARRPAADLLIGLAEYWVLQTTSIRFPSGDVTLRRMPGMPGPDSGCKSASQLGTFP